MLQHPTLVELNDFILSLINLRRMPKPEKACQFLVKSSLKLFDNLPASRDIVLEYFALAFDLDTKHFAATADGDDYQNSGVNDAVQKIQEALDNLVLNGATAWSMVISKWSVRLIAILSTKYMRKATDEINSTCLFWMKSRAIRYLISLTISCIHKLNTDELNDFVVMLTDTLNCNSPHFDWVVGVLGGCFPSKLIPQILKLAFNSNTPRNATQSEISILNYLAHSHQKDLVTAFENLLADPTKERIQDKEVVIPYLIHLSAKSPVLLQAVKTVVIQIWTKNEQKLNHEKMIKRISMWFNTTDKVTSYQILRDLILKIQTGVFEVLMKLAQLAETYGPAHILLEYLLVELESLVVKNESCSFINELKSDKSKSDLWRRCAKSEGVIEQQTAVRVLLLIASNSNTIYQQTICHLINMKWSDDKKCMEAVLRMMNGPYIVTDSPSIKDMLKSLMERIWIECNRPKSTTRISCPLENLLTLVRLEKNTTILYLRTNQVSNGLIMTISKLLDIFQHHLNKVFTNKETKQKTLPFCNKRRKLEMMDIDDEEINYDSTVDVNVVHIIVDLLHILETHQKEYKLSYADSLKMMQLVVKYYFYCLTLVDSTIKTVSIERVNQILTRHCSLRKAARSMCLRELIERALFINADLLGSKIDIDLQSDIKEYEDSLMEQNYNLVSIPTKKEVKIIEDTELNEKIKRTKNIFINTLTMCCVETETAATFDALYHLTLLLIELISPDVMYNGLPWPEEDFCRVTMERDLQIRRSFQNSPILWSIMTLIAQHRPALCFTSVLLRGLCASLLHQWRAKTINKPAMDESNAELLLETRQLLELLSLGQLLPPPLSYLPLVVEHLNTIEITVVLKDCVWNYMRDNVPSPELFVPGTIGTNKTWRNTEASPPAVVYVDPLRNIMQKKITTLSAYYFFMFTQSELEAEKK